MSRSLEEPRMVQTTDATGYETAQACESQELGSLESCVNIWFQRLWKNWYKEALSALAAFALISGLAALLLYVEGSPIAPCLRWIQPNTIASLIMTLSVVFLNYSLSSIIRACGWDWFQEDNGNPSIIGDFCKYDDASNGAWGSFFFVLSTLSRRLISRRGLELSMASMMLLLTLPQFLVQQVISYDLTSIVSGNGTKDAFIGNVARVTSYVDYISLDSATGNSLPTIGALTAIYRGTMGMSAQIDPTACSTGNCSWPIIPTIGVCGGCGDVAYIRTRDRIESATGIYLDRSSNLSYANNMKLTTTTFVLRSQFGAPDSPKPVIYDLQSSSTAYLAVFDILGMPYNTSQWNTQDITSAQCALWFCVQARNVSTHNGLYQETVIEYFAKTQDTAAASLFHSPLKYEKMPRSMNTDPTEPYEVGYLAWKSLQKAMSEFLTGNVTFIGKNKYKYQPSQMEFLWQTIDLGVYSWIEDFAAQLTYAIRSTSNQTLSPTAQAYYQGTIFADRMVLRVSNIWLTSVFLIISLASVFVISGIALIPRDFDWEYKQFFGPAMLIFHSTEFQAKMRKIIVSQNGLETNLDAQEVYVRETGTSERPSWDVYPRKREHRQVKGMLTLKLQSGGVDDRRE